MLSTVLAATALVVSLFAILFAAAARAFVKQSNKRSVALKEIALLSSEVTELKDAYTELLSSHKKLRSRIGMRKVRSDRKDTNSDGLPDPAVDPAGWKRAMRLRLHMQNKGA